MEKENKKMPAPDINEDLMMSLMVDGVKKGGIQVPLEPMSEAPESKTKLFMELPREKAFSKERGRTKRAMEADYENIFFKKTETNARDGKTVYIRPDFHEKMSRIVHVIGGNRITIYGYLDNLLDYHFQEFGDQITKTFNAKYKPIL